MTTSRIEPYQVRRESRTQQFLFRTALRRSDSHDEAHMASLMETAACHCAHGHRITSATIVKNVINQTVNTSAELDKRSIY